jgi:uncharacterized protein YqhQ
MADARRYVGGQAVMEGVMMRGATSWAVAVRRPDGEIEVDVNEAPTWAQRYSKFPLLRGVVALAESMSLGIRALTWSAHKAADDGESEPMTRGQVVATVAGALVFFSLVFMVLPGLVAKLAGDRLAGTVEFNVFEGVVKMAMFLGYIAFIGRMPDIRRVFQYHGAEHKAIAAYENDVALTPESAQRFTTQHVRCGTNFLLLVLALSIALHAVFGRPSWAVLLASRLLLIPVVAGVAYEFIRYAASHMHRRWVRTLMVPGLAMQRMTTREPDLDQLEVAIASLRAVLTAEQLAEVDARTAPTPPLTPSPSPRPGLAPA